MNFLPSGHFFGETNRTIHLSGITLTDTVIESQEEIDWHYHENAYFTLILQGNLIESNKKNRYQCAAGSLLFRGRQEPHYDVQLENNTKFFNVEFGNDCLKEFPFEANALEGIINIENHDIKFLFYKIFKETKICDDLAFPAIQMLLYEAFGQMLRFKQTKQKTQPAWTKKLKEILHCGYAEKFSLENLSNELNIHPAHLSRDFSKHFHCTFGEYVRKVRVERSFALLPEKNHSLTEIAFECGFSDQSHFLRCFKQFIGINPYTYRKFLLG